MLVKGVLQSSCMSKGIHTFACVGYFLVHAIDCGFAWLAEVEAVNSYGINTVFRVTPCMCNGLMVTQAFGLHGMCV